MNWYIGQEIVALKTNDAIIKDKIYIIKSISKTCCSTVLDVGVICKNSRLHCKCGNEVYRGHVWWLEDILFAPLMDISELESILQQEPKKEKV